MKYMHCCDVIFSRADDLHVCHTSATMLTWWNYKFSECCCGCTAGRVHFAYSVLHHGESSIQVHHLAPVLGPKWCCGNRQAQNYELRHLTPTSRQCTNLSLFAWPHFDELASQQPDRQLHAPPHTPHSSDPSHPPLHHIKIIDPPPHSPHPSHSPRPASPPRHSNVSSTHAKHLCKHISIVDTELGSNKFGFLHLLRFYFLFPTSYGVIPKTHLGILPRIFARGSYSVLLHWC